MGRWLTLAALAALSGCSLEPKYAPPAVPTAAAYKEQGPAPADQVEWKPAQPGDHLPRGSWWTLFGDSRLDQLEVRVATANPNVQAAAAVYRQARALVTVGTSGYFPQLATNPQVARSYGGSGGATTKTQWNVPLTASWEPDFWGATRLGVKGAKKTAEAEHAAYESEVLAMQSLLAIDYFTLESVDMQRVLLSSAAEDYERSVDLTRTRFNNGVVSEADVDQAVSQLEATKAQLTDLGITRAQLEHAIAVLVGQSPSQFSLATGTISGLPPSLPAGLPSQLLQRRPDVAEAERLVAAANARVGVARSAYFPIISLLATGGFEHSTLSDLIGASNRYWSLGAAGALTLLDFGRRKGLREQAWAQFDQAAAQYRQTALGAFQSVEDDLAGVRLLGQEAGEQQAAVKAAEDSLRLVLERYEAGLVSYVEVITAQNAARTAEVTAAQILGRRMNSTVALVRDLGGGWDAAELAKAPQLPPPAR